MTNQLTLIIVGVLTTGMLSWTTWVTIKLMNLHHSIRYLNDNLFLVDWEKLPKKNLNEIFNKQKQ